MIQYDAQPLRGDACKLTVICFLMPLTAVRLSRSTSVAICEEDFSAGSRVLAYAARETSVRRTSSSSSGRSKVSGDALIDAISSRATVCVSFEGAELRAFFLDAAEEPSDFAFVGNSGLLGHDLGGCGGPGRKRCDEREIKRKLIVTVGTQMSTSRGHSERATRVEEEERKLTYRRAVGEQDVLPHLRRRL